MNTQRNALDPVLVAVDDVALHPEATHLAAATGRPIIDVASTADTATFIRHFASAHAVLADVAFADSVRRQPPRPGVFIIGCDVESIDEHHALCPAAQASFVLPAQAAELLRALGKLTQATNEMRGQGTVIAVVGAAGGVGASTIGASISRVADHALAPTLVDAHRYSGGLDLLAGIEDEIGARWGEIVVGEGAVERSDIRRALPHTADEIAVLTCARTTINDPFVLDAPTLDRTVAALASSGLTVIDCPPDLVPQHCGLAVIVTLGEVRSAAATARIVAEWAANRIPAVLILRRRAWSGLSASDVERVTKARVIAEVPEIRGLTRTIETSGLPQRLPRALIQAARAVLAEVTP